MPGRVRAASRARSIMSSKSRSPRRRLRAPQAASQRAAEAVELDRAHVGRVREAPGPRVGDPLGEERGRRRPGRDGRRRSPWWGRRFGGEGLLAARVRSAPSRRWRHSSGSLVSERGGQRFAAGAVGLAARGEVGEEAADGIARLGREDGGEQGLGREPGLRAERAGEGFRLEAAGEGGAVPGDLEEQRVGVVAADRAGDGGEAGRLLAGEAVEDVGAERLGLAVVEDAELGGDAGLEREAAEQRLAEGVDRLDLEAARGLERPREEGARVGDLLGRDRLVGVAAPSRAARRAASSSIAQPPRVAKSRVCISAAAALV